MNEGEYLRRCVELATEAVAAGDFPFGSVLVGADGTVLAASSAQLAAWRAEQGLPAAPVAVLPINAVAPGITTAGPVPPFDEEMRVIHQRRRG